MFLHGLGGGRGAWEPQLAALASSFRCLAWDLPGYGDATPIEPLTFRGIAERAVGLLDAAEVDRADLVGLSFGGMHALHTAIHFPDRVRRLVLADTSPAFGLDGTTRDDWVAARTAPLDAGATPGDMAAAVLDAITATPLTDPIRAELTDCFARITPDAFRAAVACLPDHDVRDQLAGIAHRTLVIVGGLDRETPPSYSEALVAGLPNATLHVLDGVGHLSPSEAPERFNALVAEFLTSP